MTVRLTPSNTIVGLRVDEAHRPPAYPPSLADFDVSSDNRIAELEAEMAEALSILASTRNDLDSARRLACQQADLHLAELEENRRLREQNLSLQARIADDTMRILRLERLAYADASGDSRRVIRSPAWQRELRRLHNTIDVSVIDLPVEGWR